MSAFLNALREEGTREDLLQALDRLFSENLEKDQQLDKLASQIERLHGRLEIGTREPEFKDAAGLTRKAHYGAGRQPWDDILDQGWGAIFAAGNALKYVRRADRKNGADDVAKGRWYYGRLVELQAARYVGAMEAYHRLHILLTAEEVALLQRAEG